MFSKELENLIKATLEDGILEDYEKAALAKRAEAEGVDLTELEIYINSILQKRKRELEQQKNLENAVLEQQKKEEFGKRCPACGRQVESMALNCVCGYEFKQDRHVSSVQLLSEKIEEISRRRVKDEEQREKDILNAINMFPVPNTKEDIMEFLALAVPNSRLKNEKFGTPAKRLKIALPIAAVITLFLGIIALAIGGGEAFLATIIGAGFFLGGFSFMGAFEFDKETLEWNKKATVWRAKFEQVMMKGRSLRGDEEFNRMLDYYEQQIRK